MPITPDEFRSALSRFASGVTVVTTKDAEGRLHGITVSAFCSVSLEPPLVLICIEKVTASHYAFLESGMFVVNVLNAGQENISEHFASPVEDKFDGVDITLNIDGMPRLSGCIAVLDCSVKQAVDGGDHTIFIGEVDRAEVADGDPLVHYRSGYRELGS